MDTHWFNKLISTLMIQTNGENEKLMILYLDKELGKLKLPYTIDAAGNVLVTKGKAKTYPCVVSHMDTVHDFADNFKIYKDLDDDDLLFAMDGKKRIGIGGDDKCGVFACLYLLKVIPEIKVVFFSREESGCRGSSKVDIKFFSDCRYLIQLDRRGKRDFIQTYWGDKTISHEFASEIGLTKKKYKYKNAIGTVTDVMKLWKSKVGISCLNLSCGYYKAHSMYEYVSISSLWHSVKFTEEIVNTMQPKRYPSLPPPPVVTKTVPYKSLYKPCCKCGMYKKSASLWDWNGYEKICWDCKKGINDNIPKLPVPKEDSKKEGKIFACQECGIKAPEMNVGGSLKYINGELLCNKCAAVFYVFDKKPIRCYVCNEVIPKDHKIIERFGIRICEECACPSDTVLDISDIEADPEKPKWFDGENNFVK